MFLMAARFERLADRADAAVHHVGRREHVAAGVGLRQRLLDQRFDGLVVGDFAFDQKAVMAVARCKDRAPRRKSRPFRGTRAFNARTARQTRFSGLNASLAVSSRKLLLRVGEKRDGRHAEFRGFLGGVDGEVDGKPLHARHGWDRLAHFLAVHDENRPDQVRGRERSLRHERAGPCAPGGRAACRVAG